MKITNTQIKLIIDATVKLELDIPQASARRRVLRALGDFNDDIEILRNELLEKYADKENGQPKKRPNGTYVIPTEGLKKLRKDFQKVLDEVIEIKVDETNKKDWSTMKKILEAEITKNTKDKLNAERFDFVENLKEIVEVIK